MRVNVLRLEPAILKSFNNPTTGYMQPSLLQSLSITGPEWPIIIYTVLVS